MPCHTEYRCFRIIDVKAKKWTLGTDTVEPSPVPPVTVRPLTENLEQRLGPLPHCGGEANEEHCTTEPFPFPVCAIVGMGVLCVIAQRTVPVILVLFPSTALHRGIASPHVNDIERPEKCLQDIFPGVRCHLRMGKFLGSVHILCLPTAVGRGTACGGRGPLDISSCAAVRLRRPIPRFAGTSPSADGEAFGQRVALFPRKPHVNNDFTPLGIRPGGGSLTICVFPQSMI